MEEERDAYEIEARELRHRLTQASRTEPSQLGLLVTLEAARSRAESQAAWCVKTLAWLRGQTQAKRRPLDPPDSIARGARLRPSADGLQAAGE